MGRKLIDICGQRFGMLLVVERAKSGAGESRWRCRCDCGKDTIASSSHLRAGQTTSCGCFRVSFKRTHGHSSGFGKSRGSRTYLSWQHMIQRCTNPKNDRFHSYGGRGITICARWLESFENFMVDMGSRPNGMSLDRIDNDGNYCPENCRWSTFKEQTANRDAVKAKASTDKALRARWQRPA
jgi:hypothetical protein